MAAITNLTPIVSNIFRSHTPVVFMVRNRPHVVNGGGFVVTDSSQNVVFRVDGFGTLGTKGELILRDADGKSLLFIRRKGGIVQALSVWKGYMIDSEGAEKQVFTMKERASWVAGCSPVLFLVSAWGAASIQGTTCTRRKESYLNSGENEKFNHCGVPKVESKKHKDWDFELLGSFLERACSITDGTGNVVAQVLSMEELRSMAIREIYHVLVHPCFDQAFVFGVIAVLDSLNSESTP